MTEKFTTELPETMEKRKAAMQPKQSTIDNILAFACAYKAEKSRDGIVCEMLLN